MDDDLRPDQPNGQKNQRAPKKNWYVREEVALADADPPDTYEAPEAAPPPGKPAPAMTLTEIEQTIERIGARYIADLRALSAEFSEFYAAQLAAKDEQIAALTRRAEAATRANDELAAQAAELQRAHDVLVAQLDEAQAAHDDLSARLDEIREDRDDLAAQVARIRQARAAQVAELRRLSEELAQRVAVVAAMPESHPTLADD
jgi:chromosome segregation ATPase